MALHDNGFLDVFCMSFFSFFMIIDIFSCQRNYLLRNLDKRQLKRQICPFSCMLCMQYDVSILPTCGTFMADKKLSNSYFVLEFLRLNQLNYYSLLRALHNSYRPVYTQPGDIRPVLFVTARCLFQSLFSNFFDCFQVLYEIQFTYPAGV